MSCSRSKHKGNCITGCCKPPPLKAWARKVDSNLRVRDQPEQIKRTKKKLKSLIDCGLLWPFACAGISILTDRMNFPAWGIALLTRIYMYACCLRVDCAAKLAQVVAREEKRARNCAWRLEEGGSHIGVAPRAQTNDGSQRSRYEWVECLQPQESVGN